jgi:tetratricopeptide (TPR) repeat protein
MKTQLLRTGAIALTIACGSIQMSAWAQSPTAPRADSNGGKQTGPPELSIISSVFYLPTAAEEHELMPLRDAADRAERLMQGGNLSAAETTCLDAIIARKKVSRPVFAPAFEQLLANVYLRQGRYPEAIRLFLLNPDAGASNSPNVLNLTIAYCRLGDYRNALNWFHEVERQEQWVFGYTLLGGKAAPLEYWPTVRTLSGLEANALTIHGILQGSLTFRDRALQDFLAAADLAPNNALIPTHIARILERSGMYEDAARYYRRAATLGRGALAQWANEGAKRNRVGAIQKAKAAKSKPSAQLDM